MIFFYRYYSTKDDTKYYPFSQWYVSNMVDKNDITYISCEQYMMAQKALLFNDIDVYDEIMKSKSQYIIKRLGRKVKNFDETIWNNESLNIVIEGNFYKFSQNSTLRKLLLDTNDSYIAEASPYDKIWGIGVSICDAKKGKRNGLNKLGEALMEVRKRI